MTILPQFVRFSREVRRGGARFLLLAGALAVPACTLMDRGGSSDTSGSDAGTAVDPGHDALNVSAAISLVSESSLDAPAVATGEGATRQLAAGAGTRPPLSAIRMKSGETLFGWVVENDGSSVRVRLRGGGSARFPYERLDPRTVYQLKLGLATEGDAASHFELAEYARSVRLYANAARHYQRAIDLDPDQAERAETGLAKVRHEAAEHQLELGRAQMQKGNHRKAEKYLGELLQNFPEEPAAEQADALLAQIEREVAEEWQKEGQAQVAKALEPVQKDVQTAEELNLKALRLTKSGTRAQSLFRQSIARYEQAERKLNGLSPKLAENTSLETPLADWRARIQSGRIDTMLNLASFYSVRTSYREALDVVNQGLTHDPGNRDLLAMRARIENNVNSGWGAGRNWRGRR